MFQPPTNPSDCKHRGRLFIRESAISGDTKTYRDHVSLCPNCGTFLVFARINGESINIDFTLPAEEMVIAAGQYARLLAQDEESETAS